MRRILTASLVFALMITGSTPLDAQGQACSVTLSPEQSIQAAIDNARRGDVICLEAGTWEESIVINRTLTIQGIGNERSTIDATTDDEGDTLPVIGVNASSQKIKVIRLRNLELTGSQAESIGQLAGGVSVLNPAAKGSASLILHGIRITDNISGVKVEGPNVSMRIAE